MSPSAALGLIAIGTNEGDRLEQIRFALRALEEAGFAELDVGSVVESAAVGGPLDQAADWNTVLAYRLAASPRDVLDRLLTIEDRAGRTRRAMWSARVLDLDLLVHGTACSTDPDLRLPHPLLPLRPFVLEPIPPGGADVRCPLSGCRLRDWLQHLRTTPRWALVERHDWERLDGNARQTVQEALRATTGPPHWCVGPSGPDPNAGDDPPRVVLDPNLPPCIHAATVRRHNRWGPLPVLPWPGDVPSLLAQVVAVLAGSEVALRTVLPPGALP